VIRRARAEDWEDACALWREVDDQHAALAPSYFRRADRFDRQWRELLTAPETAVFVAVAEAPPVPAAVAGFATARIYETPPDPAMVPLRRGHIETLVVGRAHRRRGLGTRLMAEATAWARRQGAAELVLTVWAGNHVAESFYERLGYGVLSRVLRKKL
jgi:ribosomal protein S18 acetylase RimI-like enzyme